MENKYSNLEAKSTNMESRLRESHDKILTITRDN